MFTGWELFQRRVLIDNQAKKRVRKRLYNRNASYGGGKKVAPENASHTFWEKVVARATLHRVTEINEQKTGNYSNNSAEMKYYSNWMNCRWWRNGFSGAEIIFCVLSGTNYLKRWMARVEQQFKLFPQKREHFIAYRFVSIK